MLGCRSLLYLQTITPALDISKLQLDLMKYNSPTGINKRKKKKLNYMKRLDYIEWIYSEFL